MEELYVQFHVDEGNIQVSQGQVTGQWNLLGFPTCVFVCFLNLIYYLCLRDMYTRRVGLTSWLNLRPPMKIMLGTVEVNWNDRCNYAQLEREHMPLPCDKCSEETSHLWLSMIHSYVVMTSDKCVFYLYPSLVCAIQFHGHHWQQLLLWSIFIL